MGVNNPLIKPLLVGLRGSLGWGVCSWDILLEMMQNFMMSCGGWGGAGS